MSDVGIVSSGQHRTSLGGRPRQSLRRGDHL